MKKFLTSKPFLVTILIALCVVIVAACLFLNQDHKTKFIPDPPKQNNFTNDWHESGSGDTNAKPPVHTNSTQEQEAYPKVIEEDGKDVIIDFTPPQSSETEPPETPAGKTEIEKPQQKPKASHPVNPDSSVKPSERTPSEPKGPTPGSTNSQGQVYDAVFGWVTPSKTETVPSDNDGDLNKMVGSMD
ncbi:DUF6550 family protein [Anaerotignum sp.]|uniref:DUF6550 family protein n=1 Tax=Anaerotignum sp. TaxID=2039241 RepID=UPI0028AF5E96|nr:DUF6550 family protein [Anaerotignum sp.]